MRTGITAIVTKNVDGDTIRVELAKNQQSEALRILSLDTEESRPGSSKPVTPWGIVAKQEAEQFFAVGDTVKLEFPGDEPVDVCLEKYRGNFGRLLVFVISNEGVDYQRHMIEHGFSPYFTKYGYAPDDLHKQYDAAERKAQKKHIGVWDQFGVNGSELRNYAALGTWWRLRAEIINQYRSIVGNDELLNSRLDYKEIVKRAATGEDAVVFTELRSIQRVQQSAAVIRIGSQHQPFSLFLPNIENSAGQKIIQLLESRYISSDETHPRRSYAYVTGALSEFGSNGNPQIVVTAAHQISDQLP